MTCPYCQKQMEKGRFAASAAGSIPVAFLEWYDETQFENKGIFAAFKRKGISIKDSEDGYYPNSQHCRNCKRVFAEFSTK